MANSQIELQYRYSGRGPVDAKSLVKTYDALLQSATWFNDGGKVAAYNGMVVAVWLDAEASKNGLYMLYDPTVINVLKTPDVTLAKNWHKLAELADIDVLSDRLADLEAALIDAQATQLYREIASEYELPTDAQIAAADFNPNIVYYVVQRDSDGISRGYCNTYIFDTGTQAYMCTSNVDESAIRAVVLETLELELDAKLQEMLPAAVSAEIKNTFANNAILHGGNA